MIARSAKIKKKPISSKTGVATATPVLCFLAWHLPHQDFTDRYDGRHTTFLNTILIEKIHSVLAVVCAELSSRM